MRKSTRRLVVASATRSDIFTGSQFELQMQCSLLRNIYTYILLESQIQNTLFTLKIEQEGKAVLAVELPNREEPFELSPDLAFLEFFEKYTIYLRKHHDRYLLGLKQKLGSGEVWFKRAIASHLVLHQRVFLRFICLWPNTKKNKHQNVLTAQSSRKV